MQAFHPHLRLETDLQYKHIKEQHVNEKFDNIKQTQGPVLNQNTDKTAAVTVVLLVAHFNVKLESLLRDGAVTGTVNSSWGKDHISGVQNRSTVPIITTKTFTGKKTSRRLSSKHLINKIQH